MKRKLYILIAVLVVGAFLLLLKHEDRVERHRVQTIRLEQIQKAQHLQNIEKSNHELELQLDKTEKQKQELEQKNQDQQNQINDLNKQLSVKKAEQQRLASIQISPKVAGGSCESYRPLFAQYGWDVQTAMAIMDAESGCNPTAVSPTDDHGLMQINHGLAIYGQQIYDPAFNISIAFNEKYSKGGWGHWTVYKTGAYLKYMGV